MAQAADVAGPVPSLDALAPSPMAPVPGMAAMQAVVPTLGYGTASGRKLLFTDDV